MKKLIFSLITISFFSNILAQLPFRTGNVGNCWTVGSLTSKVGIQPCYEDAIPWDYHNGCLKDGNKWAIYRQNQEGKTTVSKALFDTVIPLGDFFGYKDNKTHKYGLVNDTFAILTSAKYDSIGLFARWVYTRIEPPMPKEMELYDMPYTIVVNCQKYGLIDKNGKDVLPCIYNKIFAINSFSVYYAPDESKPDSLIPKEYHFYIVQKKQKYALFQVANQKSSLFKYDKISLVGKSNYYFEVYQKGRYGLIDTTFKEILPCIYNRIWVWNDSLLYVKKAGLCAVMDDKGKMILPFAFEEITMIKDYEAEGNFYFKTRRNKQIEMWTHKGKPKIGLGLHEEENKEVVSISNKMYHGYQITAKNGKWGVIYPIEEDILIPFLYEKIEGIGNGFWVKKDNRWNRINFDGQKIGDLDYDRILSIAQNGRCIVAKNGKQGIYDAYIDKEIVACKYENLVLRSRKYDLFSVYTYTKNNLYGFIYFEFTNEEAQTISPALFEEFTILAMPLISVKINGAWRIWNIERLSYFYNKEANIVVTKHVDGILYVIAKELQSFSILKVNEGRHSPDIISPLWEKYIEIASFPNLLWVLSEGKWKIFNLFSMKIAPEYQDYDAITEEEGYYVVENAGKKGLLSPKLQKLLPCIHEELNTKNRGNNVLEVNTSYGKYYYFIESNLYSGWE